MTISPSASRTSPVPTDILTEALQDARPSGAIVATIVALPLGVFYAYVGLRVAGTPDAGTEGVIGITALLGTAFCVIALSLKMRRSWPMFVAASCFAILTLMELAASHAGHGHGFPTMERWILAIIDAAVCTSLFVAAARATTTRAGRSLANPS